jgi:protein PET117
MQAMHMGVIRDYEQQRVKRERQADFEMQRELEKEYLKYQTVSDGGGPAAPQQPGASGH